MRWDPDTDGDLARISPRDATYTYLRQPGVGGSLVLRDSMIFLCPANPTLAGTRRAVERTAPLSHHAASRCLHLQREE